MTPARPFGLMEQPVILETARSFNYSALKSEIRLVVEQRTSELKSIFRRSTLDILEIGQKLIEVKEKLGHGHFLNWIEAEFDLDERTVRRYMGAAESFGLESDIVTDLNFIPTTLYVLSAPSTPDSARTEALSRAKAGESITPTIAKTIVNEHRQITKQKKVSNRITIDTPAETLERELSATVRPVGIQRNQPSFELINKPDEVADVEPMRYATPTQNFILVEEPPLEEDEAQDEQNLSGEEPVTDFMTISKVLQQEDQLEQFPLEEAQGKYSEASAPSQEVDPAQTIVLEQIEQELEEATEVSDFACIDEDTQNALQMIYSFLTSEAKEYFPKFPNLKFSEVDAAIQQIASNSDFCDVATNERLAHKQIEEVWEAIAPRVIVPWIFDWINDYLSENQADKVWEAIAWDVSPTAIAQHLPEEKLGATCRAIVKYLPENQLASVFQQIVKYLPEDQPAKLLELRQCEDLEDLEG